MRRILVCFFTMLMVLAGIRIAAAEAPPKLDIGVGNGHAIITSNYQLKLTGYGDGERTPTLWVRLQKSRFTSTTSVKFYEMQIGISWLDSMPNPVVFSVKHSPYFLLVTDTEKKSMKIKKYSAINESSMTWEVNKKIMESIFNAEKVYLMLYLSNGDLMKIRMKQEVIDQWKEVINADLKKISKEFKNR